GVNPRSSVDELDGDAGLYHFCQFRRVPVGKTDAAMAVGLADLRRLGRSVDAVARLRQGDPHRADRAVRSRWDLQDLVVIALLEVDLRVVGIAGIERDA